MYSNMTTIEALGAGRGNKFGPVQERLPCIGVKKSEQSKIPNQYDLLWPNNLRLVLGPNVFSWPIPWIIPNLEDNGYNFQRIAGITSEEHIKLEKEGFLDTMLNNKKVKYELKDKFTCSIDDYVKKAMEKYQDTNIVVQKSPRSIQEDKIHAQSINSDIDTK